MKTSELTGQALNWAVALCKGNNPVMRFDYLREHAKRNNYAGIQYQHIELDSNVPFIIDATGVLHPLPYYCEVWEAGGGNILTDEKICTATEGEFWVAWIYEDGMRYIQSGQTPLVAGLRTFVESVLGSEVAIPKELE